MVPWKPVPDVARNPGEVVGRRRISTASLPSQLPEELLRGVPLDKCLESWGWHFSSQLHEADMVKNFGLSQVTPSINTFISHDWGTSRLSKTGTLLIYFNSVPAALMALLASVLTSVLVLLDMFPGSWMAASASMHCLFYFVLCFWQRIRTFLFRMTTLVFLDRICIAQHDEDLKRQGVLGLGGFLAKTQTLLVLWSPQYLTRLWCVFEIACCLRPEASVRTKIEIQPVAMALLLWTSSFVVSVLVVTLQVFYYIFSSETIDSQGAGWWTPIRVGYALIGTALLPLALVVLPMQLYWGMRHMKELLRLPQQLANFSIRQSRCTCCSFEHCHPASGDVMLCDREMVYLTLDRWYPGSSYEGESLDRFDDLVRRRLGTAVLLTMGSGVPALRYVLAMIVSPTLAALPMWVYLAQYGPEFTERWTGLSDVEDAEGFQWHWLLDYSMLPATALFLFWAGNLLWRMGATRLAHAQPCLAVAILEIFGFSMMVLFGGPYEITVTLNEPIYKIGTLLLTFGMIVAAYVHLYRGTLGTLTALAPFTSFSSSASGASH